MSGFHKLTVTGLRKTIRDAVVVTLLPQDASLFDFIPGQYLTLRQKFDVVELRRSYSICAPDTLQVGIKRVDGGAFSTWANTELRIGDVVEAMPPMGRFHTQFDPAQPRNFLGFAGGSGITPVLSIISKALAVEPQSIFTLVYANRGVNTIMFREELEDLKNRHMGRFRIIHILETDTQDIDLFAGRIDAAKCDALFAAWIDVAQVDLAFICGPEPMMQTISASLQDHGLRKDQMKYELFTSGQQGQLPKVASSAKAAMPVEATVVLDGTARRFTMERGQSLLDAARAHDIDAPYACKAGVCSTCRCRVIEGEVEMAANHALEDYEVAQGFALSCQAYPISARVMIDYDLH